MGLIIGRLRELGLGFSLLTRLPVAKNLATLPSLNDIAWTFPLVGAAIGFLTACFFYIAWLLTASISIAVICAISIQILLTGCFHEDGLADVADGFGGGKNPEHKYQIMQDSRLGSYGTAAFILNLMALNSFMVNAGSAFFIAQNIIVINILSRCLIPFLPIFFPICPFSNPQFLLTKPRIVDLFFLICIFIGIVGYFYMPINILVYSIIAGCFVFCIGKFACRHILGVSGDVYGASQQLFTLILWFLLSVK